MAKEYKTANPSMVIVVAAILVSMIEGIAQTKVGSIFLIAALIIAIIIALFTENGREALLILSIMALIQMDWLYSSILLVSLLGFILGRFFVAPRLRDIDFYTPTITKALSWVFLGVIGICVFIFRSHNPILTNIMAGSGCFACGIVQSLPEMSKSQRHASYLRHMSIGEDVKRTMGYKKVF